MKIGREGESEKNVLVRATASRDWQLAAWLRGCLGWL
jgi:hypothetical protein